MKNIKASLIIKDMLLEMVIKSAITFEEESRDFYQNAINKVADQESKNLLTMLMNEEETHLQKLRFISTHSMDEIIQSINTQEITLLNNEYIEKRHTIKEDANVNDILELALEREKASCQFYSLLSQKTKMEHVKNLFAFLAKEEEQHRNHVESEYHRLNNK